jgi:hypothetical protein
MRGAPPSNPPSRVSRINDYAIFQVFPIHTSRSDKTITILARQVCITFRVEATSVHTGKTGTLVGELEAKYSTSITYRSLRRFKHPCKSRFVLCSTPVKLLLPGVDRLEEEAPRDA